MTFDAPLVELPLGAIFEHEEGAYLVAAAGYLRWSFGGYGASQGIRSAPVLKVLAPQSVIRAFDDSCRWSMHPRVYMVSLLKFTQG